VVVSTDRSDSGNEAFDLLDEGFLDSLQLHGEEKPAECFEKAFPYYKALSLAAVDQVNQIGDYHSPRVLIDAHVPGKGGGTGVRVSPEIVAAARKISPLWLAGGLNPDNVAETVRRFEPELVDVSTGIESSPGVKDVAKLRNFIEEAKQAYEGV
jgi:indole-3-glycerol phosphate synthase/phosphoribosylanthranilate isomerase